jgi:hypothetical protein
LIQRHKNKLNNLIYEGNKNLLKLKEKNNKKKNFSLLQILDKIEFILLTYSLGLTFSFSNRVSYTTIADFISENIFYFLYKRAIKYPINPSIFPFSNGKLFQTNSLEGMGRGALSIVHLQWVVRLTG